MTISLEAILGRADRERWCTRWGCTTCGALKFRNEVLDFLGHPRELTPRAAAELLNAMTDLDPNAHLSSVEFLLRWAGKQLQEEVVLSHLRGTRLGELYARMLNARDAANVRRTEAAFRQSPEFVAQERARKAANRAAQHEERLAAKRIRDAALRASGKLPRRRSDYE